MKPADNRRGFREGGREPVPFSDIAGVWGELGLIRPLLRACAPTSRFSWEGPEAARK